MKIEKLMEKSDIIVGIDLGTTNSAIGIYIKGKVKLCPNSLGENLTPSVVAYDEKSASICVGRIAKDILALNKQNAAALFKRYMGKEETFKLNKQLYSPIELSSLILKSLKDDAEEFLNQPVDRCVITVPAYFSEEQRVAAKKAGEIAGFTVERILNEPTAAAICYGLENRQEFTKFLVFDLGGGTFDVCVMEIFDGALEVCSVAGESQLGGEDFTLTLLKLALEKINIDYNRAVDKDQTAVGLLYKRSELAKLELTSNSSTNLTIPEINKLSKKQIEVTITREEAYETFKPLMAKLTAPCITALRGAKVTKNDIEEIILVGGATRMPIIQHFVETFFDKNCLALVDPDLVVAHGSAIQGALYNKNEQVEEIVVTDVLSYSLGVDVVKEIGSKLISGYFQPIIHRNTVIPVTKADFFYPISPGQTEIELTIFEGESRHCKDNKKIGMLKVKGIPKNQSKNSVEVRFTYDLNGILEVEATILDNNQVFSKILNRSNKSISDSELEKSKTKIKKLKMNLRESAKIKGLILRVELLIKDLSGQSRELLEFQLDQFESALENRDHKLIDELYQELINICESYDQGIQW